MNNLHNCLGIRFLLQHGHVVEAVLLSHEAKKLATEWMQGDILLRDRKRIGGEDQIGRLWVVDISQIIGIVVDKVILPNQAPQQQPLSSLPAWSGVGKPPWL